MTTDICIYKLHQSRFIEKYDKKASTSIKRHISAFEHKNKISYSKVKDNIFLLHRRTDKLHLWLANENNVDKIIHLAEINKRNDSHILSSTISQDGKLIAYSDATLTVILSYDFETNDLKKVKTLRNISSKFLYFTDSNGLVLVDQINSAIHKYDIKKEIIDTIKLNTEEDIFLACDYNNETSNCVISTLRKKLILADLNKNSVDFSLPHLSDFITQLKFKDKLTILAVAENNMFYLLSTKSKKFSDWTNKNLNNFPKNYLKWYNKIMGVTIDPLTEGFLLYTDYNYIKVDLTKELPINSTIEKVKTEKLRNADWYKIIRDYHKAIFNQNYKNLSEVEKEVYNNQFNIEENKTQEINFNFKNENFKIVSRFSSILFMDYIKSKSDEKVLLVIENDWNKILKEFPEAVTKNNYGY